MIIFIQYAFYHAHFLLFYHLNLLLLFFSFGSRKPPAFPSLPRYEPRITCPISTLFILLFINCTIPMLLFIYQLLIYHQLLHHLLVRHLLLQSHLYHLYLFHILVHFYIYHISFRLYNEKLFFFCFFFLLFSFFFSFTCKNNIHNQYNKNKPFQEHHHEQI